MTKDKKTKYKKIFTLKIMRKLKEMGFEPILETDNLRKPGFKCWVYEASPAFYEAFAEVVKKGGNNNG